MTQDVLKLSPQPTRYNGGPNAGEVVKKEGQTIKKLGEVQRDEWMQEFSLRTAHKVDEIIDYLEASKGECKCEIFEHFIIRHDCPVHPPTITTPPEHEERKDKKEILDIIGRQAGDTLTYGEACDKVMEIIERGYVSKEKIKRARMPIHGESDGNYCNCDTCNLNSKVNYVLETLIED